jgi:hypothetical protein
MHACMRALSGWPMLPPIEWLAHAPPPHTTDLVRGRHTLCDPLAEALAGGSTLLRLLRWGSGAGHHDGAAVREGLCV